MTSRRQSLLVALAVLPSLLLAGCPESSSTTLSSIAITPSQVNLAVGGTRQLVVTGTYSDHTRAPITTGLTFSSSSPLTVADVSSSGLVTAVGGGSATVTASASGHTATVTVIVSVGEVPAIASFTASPSTIAPGGSSVLAWSVTGATSLSIDKGVGAVTGTSTSVSPSVTTTYTLTATNGSGSSTASVTVTVGALAQMNLPLTFDSATVAYGLLGFGGAEDSTIVADPTGGTNKVAKVVKSATAELWAGTTLTADGTLGFASKIPFTSSATKMTVRVYSPDAGIQVRLKVEEHADNTATVETEATTTAANAWQTLTFDFANQAAGTAALNLAKNYDKASIFFNFGVTGATAGAKTYYFDDVAFAGGGSPPPVIASFTASPATIAPGGSSVLAWSVTGATSLSIDQGVGAVTGTSASVSPSVTTTYRLTATNASGSSTATATVTVSSSALPVIASFTATPSSIVPGGSSTLAWSVTGATSLSIDQGVGAVTGTSASVSPAVTTTYTLTATNASGSSTATATVTVSSSNPLSALVFWDDYDPGVLPLAGFGGSYTETHPVTRDPTTTNNGRASLKMAVVAGDCQSMGGYIGGYVAAAAPRDLHAYNALTFWAKSDVPATINNIGFGNDNTPTGTNGFNVESHGPSGTGGFSLTSTWTQYFIPIPNPAALTSFSGLFYFSGGCPATTYNAWFNDIQFVSLTPSQLASTFGALSAASTGAPATLNVQVGTPARIADPGPNTINYASTAAYIVGWAYFTYATTDATVATVDSNGLVVGHKAGTCTLTLTFPGTALSQTINVTVTVPLAVPSNLATTPTVPPANVISMFNSSGTYTNHAIDTWRTSWSAGNNELVDYVILGKTVKQYTLHSFVGIEFLGANNIDVSTMGFFHIDVWSPNPPPRLEIQLVNNVGPSQVVARYEATPIATGSWVSFEVPLSSFSPSVAGNTQLGQMLFIAQDLSGGNVNSTIYVDNIYFHN